MNDIIQLRNLGKAYMVGGQYMEALKGINLDIAQGEFVAIMGPSGSGKSTLMHILGLLDVPTIGQYLLNGQDVSKLNRRQRAVIRNREIGFVFQQFNLLPRATVLDNVLLPTIYGDQKNALDRARYLINEVGLTDRINNKSNQLSGGQIQRVAIARALIMNPVLILADEPTGNLDSKTAKEIMNLFKHINDRGGTVVLITHERSLANYADRIIHLRDGQIVERKT